MKIINKITNETVAEITTNQSLTLDEAINIAGELYPLNEDESVEINGNWYYYDDLDMIYE